MSTNQLRFRSKADEFLGRYAKKLAHTTFSIGVLTPDGEEKWAFGPQLDGIQEADGIYEIGSITKVMTASMLSGLAAEGKLRIEDEVQTHLPELQGMPAGGITLKELATHTSGLPRLPLNLRKNVTDQLNPYQNYTATDLLKALNLIRPDDLKRKGTFEYSNYGYGLLGHVLSTVAKQPYEQLFAEQIANPCGLQDTVIELNEQQLPRLMPVYNEKGKPVKHWDLNAMAGAGAIRSTVADLLHFLRIQLGMGNSPQTERFQACHEPKHELNPNVQIGLGWMIRTREEKRFHWHNGGTYGSTSFIGFHKESRTGVVVLANTGIGAWTHVLASFGLRKLIVDELARVLLQELVNPNKD
ncbi:serine hydrolase domain-containing protein [Paenibacillus turpanensis]|uniref:serine hydrolase domain-containing protein n=1 Tax=Paenibacillus turpanensis TaxID=2689078 RepID=UPI00140DF36A|nr:serine hydrolase domain-containing protein [Paenibacillus turpanensis]